MERVGREQQKGRVNGMRDKKSYEQENHKQHHISGILLGKQGHGFGMGEGQHKHTTSPS